jgi:hypothetical protein
MFLSISTPSIPSICGQRLMSRNLRARTIKASLESTSIFNQLVERHDQKALGFIHWQGNLSIASTSKWIFLCAVDFDGYVFYLTWTLASGISHQYYSGPISGANQFNTQSINTFLKIWFEQEPTI